MKEKIVGRVMKLWPSLLAASILSWGISCGGDDEISHQTSLPPETTAYEGALHAGCGHACAWLPQGPNIFLPADTAAHLQYPFEWWYWFTTLQGVNINDSNDKRTFVVNEHFAAVMVPDGAGGMMPIVQGTYQVTDAVADTFVFTNEFQPGVPQYLPEAFDFSVTSPPPFPSNGDTLTGKGDLAKQALHASIKGDYVFDLKIKKERAPALLFGDGFQNEWGIDMYQYAESRMRGKGTLTIGGQTYEVQGDVLFDHHWGDLAGVGMRRFIVEIELNNGKDIFLWKLWDPSGSSSIAGGYTSNRFCQVKTLSEQDYAITELGPTWTSPTTNVEYPMKWEVNANGFPAMTVTPVREDQEVFGSLNYWNGGAKVTNAQGKTIGNAWVQMYLYPPLP